MVPMIFRIKVKSKDASFNLYIPLLLAYLLLLPAYLMIIIVYGFMLLAPQQTEEARGYMRFAFHAPALLNAAKGTEIEVHSNDADVIMFIK